MKTGIILRRITAFLIALVLCATITDTTLFAKAKLKPTLSDTKLTMWTNDIRYISLENASSEVTWKSSNKNIVKIEKTSEKYGQEISLETGNKTGSCKITAKMKNKTYCCNVTVKKGTIIKKYTGKKSKTVLEKVTQKKKSITIRYKMCAAKYKNCKCAPAAYGNAIRLEKYTDGKWSEVPMNVCMNVPCVDRLPDTYMPYPCMLCIIPPKTSISKEVHLEEYYDISQLTKGSYRLDVNVLYPHVKSSYVEFKLK